MGYLKDYVYHTNTHSVQELQTGIEAAAEEVINNMLHDTTDYSAVRLEAREVKESHTEGVFT